MGPARPNPKKDDKMSNRYHNPPTTSATVAGMGHVAATLAALGFLFFSSLAAAEAGPASATSVMAPGESATELGTITVTSTTAAGYAIDPQNAPASISIVTGEELHGKAYRDVRQALRDVPGVYVSKSQGRGGVGEIRLRGMDAKYVLVLVDGIPQGSRQAYYNGYGQGSEFGWLPPISAIKRIEVIRGPMSTIYGSAALGGVVNIITKPVAGQWHAGFGMAATLQEDPDSGDYSQANVRASGPLIDEVLSFEFDAGVFKRNEDSIPGGYAEFLRRNVNFGLSWAINERNRLKVQLGHGRQQSATHAGKSAAWSDRRDGWSTREFETERRRETVRHELQWGERTTTRSWVQRERVDQFDGSFHSTYQRITANTRTVLPFADHLLTLGAQYRRQRTENPDRGRGSQSLERSDSALFAEHQWFMTRDVTFTWGLRYVHDENYGSKLVPRVYGVYKMTPKLTIKGGVSGGYRTPNLKQGDGHWIENACGPRTDCIVVGNSTLEPEKSRTYEAGLYYQAYRGLRTSLTLFHTDFSNKIGTEFICDDPAGCTYLGVFAPDGVQRYINVGKARIRGIEFMLAAPLMETLDVNLSYTYTDSEKQTGPGAGDPLSTQPEQLANLGLQWQVNKPLRLWFQARYRGQTQAIPGSRRSDESYPPYTMVDAGATYKLGPRASLYGGIYNVLDTEITEDEYGHILDGRRYSIGLRWSF